MKKIKVELVNQYRDGGTCLYIDKDGKEYWEDNRLSTETRGKIFDRYPSNEDAKMLDVKIKVIKK